MLKRHRIFDLKRGFSLFILLGLLIGGSVQAQEGAACEEGFLLFEHELLATDPVCIPENPERVAFIDYLIAYGVALDIPSVTRSFYFDVFLNDFPAAVDADAIAAMTDIGKTWEMNPESLLEAAPDLVVTSIYWEDAIAYAQTIAPTVVLDLDRAESWRQIFDAITQIFGAEEKQEAFLEDIDERMTIFRELLESQGVEPTFTVTNIDTPDQLWTFTSMNFGVELAQQAGLTLADTIPTPEEALVAADSLYAIGISLEELPLIDADHVFLYTNYGVNSQEGLFANPVWQSFEAMNPTRIHFLRGEYWVNDNPIAAHRVLDDLFWNVVGVDPEEAAPNPFAYTYTLAEETD